MATITQIASQTSNTSEASWQITGLTASVGDWLVVAVAADNAGTNGAASLSTTLTDSASNTYDHRELLNRDPGAANAGVTASLWTAAITSALSSGSITVSFSPNTTAKAAIVYRIQPDANKQIAHVSDNNSGSGSSSTQPSVTANVNVTSGDTLFKCVGYETGTGNMITGDSDTTNGSWSTIYTAQVGTGDTGMSVSGQYKTVTATGNQDHKTTTSIACDYATVYVILRESDISVLMPKPSSHYFRMRV